MTSLEKLCIDAIRVLSAEAVQAARSGHPGMPMGMAAPAYVLWTRFLRHDPRNPAWPNRDRFVLSAGHGSMLLYALLHLTGYDLSLEELRRFRQWGSRTPGHPERGVTPGVEVTTGPLGQGFAHGVGMALAHRYLARRFNRPGHAIVDHHIYAIVSDGDLMEGISHEAASLAGHLRLGRLIYLYDDNRITIEGSTDLAFSDDTARRFDSYGWHVQAADGDDLDAVSEAIAQARATTDRPSLILTRTRIACGSPGLEGSHKAHGAPLGAEELQRTKEALQWPLREPFAVPEEVREQFRAAIDRGAGWETQWRGALEAYGRAHPEARAEWDRWQSAELPPHWDAGLWEIDLTTDALATRAASGLALNALAEGVPNLIGGSADLGESNQTVLHGYGAFGPDGVAGPNLHFGVREHAMAAALSGMSLYGGLRPFGGTFLVFADYMRPTLRLTAIMQAPVVFVFTHDSIGVGEDGPTHQPVDQLAALRAIPGLTVIRPADARETIEAWWVALQRRGPVALILTRQKVPVLPRGTGAARGAADDPLPEWISQAPAGGLPPVARGAYVFAQTPRATAQAPELILIGTGSELSLCLSALDALARRDVAARVVSMPSWELFEEQSADYRRAVLPPDVPRRLAVEAGVSLGWERYVGNAGETITLNRFGASAPQAELFAQFGFTAEAVLARARALLEARRPSNAHS
ncbi:MAG: transketolase [Candidatus Eisenbacteria bacterium]|nr:transketolase [Candidatus Eisenbacteria bacterium]